MPITVKAVYENVLKLAELLPFPEHERLRVTVEPATSPLLAAYGIIGWNGSAEELDRLLAECEEDEPS